MIYFKLFKNRILYEGYIKNQEIDTAKSIYGSSVNVSILYLFEDIFFFFSISPDTVDIFF